MNFLETIKSITIPYKTEFTKVRIGQPKDGAYILLDELCKKCDCVVSLGIGDNVEFDLDFVQKYKKNIYMADDLAEKPPLENDNFFFKKEFITKNSFLNFLNHFNIHENLDMILKMDIEGGEYDIFENLKIEEITKFSQISVEFHNLLSCPTNYIDSINVLNDEYYIYHIHANNYSPIYNGVPDTIEISFVRKNLVTKASRDINPCPHKDLDFSNNPNIKDYVLDWWC